MTRALQMPRLDVARDIHGVNWQRAKKHLASVSDNREGGHWQPGLQHVQFEFARRMEQH